MLSFIGLGLHDERGITLRGLEESKASDYVFVEFYTNPMPSLSIDRLEGQIGKPIKILSRTDIEENAEQKILEIAKNSNVSILVPGDSMTATTHIDLRLRAARLGIETTLIHGVSAISSAASSTGLQIYKFGKAVTIPIVESDTLIETPYNVIKENSLRGLHSLILLDVKADIGKYLLIRDALQQLLDIEKKRQERITHEERLAVGIARIGADDMVVKGGIVRDLKKFDFGPYPHLLIFPGKLHFIEAETLEVFAKTNRSSMETHL